VRRPRAPAAGTLANKTAEIPSQMIISLRFLYRSATGPAASPNTSHGSHAAAVSALVMRALE